MKLLQVCNVGQICGGTAACAWTVARSWPEWQHVVLFLSPIAKETHAAFRGIEIQQVARIDDSLLQRYQPNLVILHNTPAAKVGQIESALTLYYQHSRGASVDADCTVACSKWLCGQSGQGSAVLYQPVPRAGAADHDSRALDDEFVCGRICTPGDRKWPTAALPVYAAITKAIPEIRWEFVGCPTSLQPQWNAACNNRVRFLPAGWQQRERLQTWHALIYHHPTLTESFGRTVAEAMRAGCVPIVDARGGFCDQIVTTETGFLCRTRDDFTCAAIALSNCANWKRISAAAKHSAERQFSPFAFRKEFQRLILQLAHGSLKQEADRQ